MAVELGVFDRIWKVLDRLIGPIRAAVKKRAAESRYRFSLREEVRSFGIMGSPDIESMPVGLDEAFVSLRISPSWRSEWRFDPAKQEDRDVGRIREDETRHLPPDEMMKRAFREFRVLLIIGDPGCGKTTLLKYYALCGLNKKHGQLGFDRRILPLFFPLRELVFKDDGPLSLAENLAAWSSKRSLDIQAQQFQTWLDKRKTLVLLDGLDEIGNLEKRRAACDWIKHICNGFKNVRLVVTARWTGFRKSDCIELECGHLRADVLDFSAEQRREFLKKWFPAVFLADRRGRDVPGKEWQQRQRRKGEARANALIDFLDHKENRSVRELAGVPMLLQIMAVIWKERDYRPESRTALFDAALNYLLQYREQRRGRELKPLLDADKARRVLGPAALWMQERLQRDEAPKEEMHGFMEPILKNMDDPPTAPAFCRNLVDRTGLIVDYGKDHYIFRHRSFREFLAGAQLCEESKNNPRRIRSTVTYFFGDDWWEETLRFYLSKSTEQIFDLFMRYFFEAEESGELDAHKQTLLQKLVQEAPQKKIDSLIKILGNRRLNHNRIKYVLDCLKTIGSEAALRAVEEAEKEDWNEIIFFYGRDIVIGAGVPIKEVSALDESTVRDPFAQLPRSFRNPFEDNVEYILIPGGQYRYSVSKMIEKVPDIYFCKYPVTNNRYRRFIAYLEGEQPELEKRLPRKMFIQKLRDFARYTGGYRKYLKMDPGMWSEQFRSHRDDDKRFNGADQPVVSITWYAARAYCLWLSCLEAGEPAAVYRLPTEIEWEWAAAGREPDGSLREYPWPKEKEPPVPTLANYDGNVGSTTPVDRYPAGATPEGLMDMAGNVWEWMSNGYDEDSSVPALRGGSLSNNEDCLRCSARNGLIFYGGDLDVGFRVVRSQS